METIYEKLAALMDELMTSVDTAINDANARAEGAKAIINEQILVLTEAADTLYSIADMEGRLADTLEASSEKVYITADKINAYLECFDIDEDVEDVPATDHTFEGYCKKCGKELYYDEYLVDTEVGRLCDKCHQYYMEHGTLDPIEEPWPVG